MNELMTVRDAVVDLLANGLLGASMWQVVLVTLVFTHITIACVTIFLHRAQAHRALELHAIPSHFFRLWLWLTTGMVTKEWVAIHRKHHAKCETVDDPHSPVTRGIKTVLLTGSELYRAEAKVQETLDKYGHNTPDDWIERNLYSRYQLAGRGRDAGHQPAAVRRHRRHGVGRADGLDPGHRRRHHQRPGPLVGLPQFRGAGRVDQHLAVGHHHRRRGAAQQPPHLPDLGQAVGQALRVRHRLALHPRDGNGRPGQGAQDAAAAEAGRGAAGGRRQDAGGDHRQPLRGDGQLRASS